VNSWFADWLALQSTAFQEGLRERVADLKRKGEIHDRFPNSDRERYFAARDRLKDFLLGGLLASSFRVDPDKLDDYIEHLERGA